MADVELLPCPFCGGKATLTITGNVRSTRKCMVKCEGCRYQRIDAALRYGDDWLRATAIAAWNRRTTTAEDANLAPLQAENERLRDELDNKWADGVHSCHDQCQRPACVLRRRAERLAEALRDARRALAFAAQHLPECNEPYERANAALAQEDRNG